MTPPILLQTKFLTPQISRTHLHRPTLVSAICDDPDQRHTVLIAPAGYGKTSLLTEVAQQAKRDVIWLQLDEGDNDPATMMAYLMEGFRRKFSGDLLSNLKQDEDIVPDRLLVILLNQLVEKTEFKCMVMLDDYHIIHNPAVHKLMMMLIENMPDGIRLIIASRITPALPLSRWHVRQQLLEVRAQQLRFTETETAQWLKLQTLELPDNFVHELVSRTEGWGAGLQLFTSVWNDRSSPQQTLERLHGSQTHIFAYLMEEVFSQQSADVQSFLLRCSIFSELNPIICERVMGVSSAQGLLTEIEKHGLFVARLDNDWFRLHQLFRDFLINRFQQQSPDDYIDIQMKAGDYFARHRQTELAFQHYVSAGAYDHAIEMLLDFADAYLIRGRFEEIQSNINLIPSDVRQAALSLRLLQAQLLRVGGQLTPALNHLEMIVHHEEGSRATLCQAQLERSAIYLSQGKYQQAYDAAIKGVELGQELDLVYHVPALMQLANCIGFVKGMNEAHDIATQAYRTMQVHLHLFTDYDRAKLLHTIGQICWWYGDVGSAIDYCRQALQLLDEVDTSLRARIYITMAIPTLYQKDYERAHHLSEKAITICTELQLSELLPAAYTALGNVLTRIGELDRAETYLRTAIHHAKDIGGARYSQVMAAGYLAQNLALQGRIEEAQRVASSAFESEHDQPYAYDVYVCHSVLADMLLESNQLVEAKSIFNKLISIGEITQYRIPLAMAYFGLAYIMLQEKDKEQALAYSQQSIALLEPSMMHQLYLDQRQRALVICQQLVQHIPDNSFVHQVYNALSSTIQIPADTVTVIQSDLLKVKTFGGFTVYRNNQIIEPKTFASAKARDTLAYFITLGTKSVSIDRAVNDLWDDDKGSVSAFHTAVYRIRVALRTDDSREKYVLSEVGEYRLDHTKFDIDVLQFDSLWERTRHTKVNQQQIDLLETALDLYQGVYLDNLYYEWAFRERERLEQQYLQMIDLYCSLLRADAQYQQLATWQEKALNLDPYNESLHVNYMQTLGHLQHRAKLVDHYQQLKQVLADAFDAEPMPETQEVYRRLVGRD